MKTLYLICAALLLFGITNLPIGYYTLLRIVVSIGAISVVVSEFENGINFWVISFGIITIIFNPLIPVYLGEKVDWIPIDIVTAIFFIIKSFSNQNSRNNE
jgi:hypothetical protein